MKKNDYLQAYKNMLLIRRFEEKCGQLYGMGLIAGFCHLYIGQEAVITGIDMAMEKGDHTITSYRDHGHILLSGIEPKYVLAELTGRAEGCSKGKGGSMHMFYPENNFHGGHGIVGAQVPLGTGIAFAEKYKGTKNICFTFFGDGAAQQGQVFEAFNMAKMWNLPVIYVIENNEYSMGTSLNRSSGNTDLSKRGASYEIPGKKVDGMDIDEVYKATLEAAKHARSGKGPYILEMKTYRYRGHSMSDPAQYRSKDEVNHYKENKDCIAALKGKILKNKYGKEEDLKKIEKEVKEIVTEAADFATNSPEPDLSELYTEIFVGE